MNEYRLTLKLASYLLEYPDNDWWLAFEEYRQAVDEIKTEQVRSIFRDIFDYISNLGAKEYEDLYVRSFDFSQNTNLYLTTQGRTDFGKQANEMQEYKQLFLKNGYDLANELPDYLPAILELAANVEEGQAAEILNQAKNKLELLRDRFAEAKLIHTFLIDAVAVQAARLEDR